jgi:arylsulfatase A-like enzyme
MRLDTFFLGMARSGGLALVVALAGCGGSSEAQRPNVLLISVDSLRRDHLSSYGYRPIFAKDELTTPAVDGLVRDGVLFEDAVSTTSWTLPAHMALMTGLADTLHGVTDNAKRLDPAIDTLAELLSARGYHTGGFFSGPNLHPVFGFGAGFETYANASGLALPDAAFEASEDEANALLGIHGQSHKGLTSPEVNRRALAWLDDAAGGEEPFFLFLHYWDPHYNYVPPADYAARFDPSYTGGSDGSRFIETYDIKSSRARLHILSLYDAEIRYTDDHIGLVLARLDELGLADDTLVVFVSDHGDEFFEHKKKGHQRNFFDESIRVPMVMRWPGHLPAGLRIDPQVRLQDVLPTVAELVDIAPPAYVTGTSLVPLIEGASEGPPAQVFELNLPRRDTHRFGLRQKGLYVYWDQTKGEGAFYDLSTDPKEQRPTPLGKLADSDLPAARLLRARLAELEAARQYMPSTAGHSGLDGLPAELEADLRANGYLGDDPEEVPR